MSASGDEATVGFVGLGASEDKDSMTISNAASASLEANPFVGEGGAYASVRPAYPDEAVAALLASARSRGGVTGDIDPAAGDPADSPSVEDASIVPAPAVPASSAPLRRRHRGWHRQDE